MFETRLRSAVREAESMLVTLSGGVDSALLALVARQELGERAAALTAVGEALPERELADCKRLADEIGIRHIVSVSREIEDPRYRENPTNRCFFCKTELYGLARRSADEHGFKNVAAGINRDDLGDYRPGIDAARENGVLMPFVEAAMGKDEIRELASRLGLSVASKPAAACLASRLPYGTAVTPERLRQVERCEDLLMELGFIQCRVRYHGVVARIEVPPSDLAAIVDNRDRIVVAFKEAGFSYVSLDLAGFRSGSMNETLPGLSHVAKTAGESA